jgi:hypothetical protein
MNIQAEFPRSLAKAPLKRLQNSRPCDLEVDLLKEAV